MNNSELRVSELHVRSDENDNHLIEGVAIVYNQPSQDMGFIEYIKPEALDGVDLSKVLLLYSHEYQNILASVESETLELIPKDDGLYFKATLPNTTLGNDVAELIASKRVTGMSFGFMISEDEFSQDSKGQIIHTIYKLESMSEISITPIPAYDETSVSTQVKRSLEQFKKGSNMSDEEQKALADLQAQVKALQDALKAKEDEPEEPVKEDEPVDDKPTDDKPKEPEDKEPEVRDDEDLPDEPDDEDLPDEPDDESEPEVRSLKTKKENESENKHMAQILNQVNEKDEITRSFAEYLKSRGEKRDASIVTTADGDAVIPEQILDIYKQPVDATTLSGYVNRVAVSAPTGKLPILAGSRSQLVTATEGADNPAIAKAQINKATYDVKTRRGMLPISYEMVNDYPEIVSLLSGYVQDVVRATEQAQIGAILQKATAVSASSIDDIKDAFNIGLTNYDRMFVVTESMYAELDKAKDDNGRYLLQDSISSASGKVLFGAPVVVVADTILGSAGDKKAFVGDVKKFALEAVKDNVAVQWVRNEAFETILGVALRADFVVADTQAGKFVTFAPVATASTGK